MVKISIKIVKYARGVYLKSKTIVVCLKLSQSRRKSMWCFTNLQTSTRIRKRCGLHCRAAPEYSCISFELATSFNYSQATSLSAFHLANSTKKVSAMPCASSGSNKSRFDWAGEKNVQRRNYKSCLPCISWCDARIWFVNE